MSSAGVVWWATWAMSSRRSVEGRRPTRRPPQVRRTTCSSQPHVHMTCLCVTPKDTRLCLAPSGSCMSSASPVLVHPSWCCMPRHNFVMLNAKRCQQRPPGTHKHTQAHICTHTGLHKHTQAHMCTYAGTHKHTQAHTGTHKHTQAHMYVHRPDLCVLWPNLCMLAWPVCALAFAVHTGLACVCAGLACACWPGLCVHWL